MTDAGGGGRANLEGRTTNEPRADGSPADAGPAGETGIGRFGPGSEAGIGRLGPGVLRLGVLALWTYLCLALLYRSRLLGVGIGAAAVTVIIVLGGALIALALARPPLARALTGERALGAGLGVWSLLLALLAGDVALTARDNLRRARAWVPLSDQVRLADSHVWHGELFPRSYHPTDQSFLLYKPNVRLTAETYGEYYSAPMQRSRTLVDSVLHLHRLTYAIGPHGLRDTEPLGAARILALGDSYALGYNTDEGRTWTDLLGAALRQPVYNLGVSATGPRQALQLLEHLYATVPESLTQVRDVLWMIYEGNDLENSYAEQWARAAAEGVSLTDGTVLQALLSLPGLVRWQSVLGRLVRGDLHLGAPAGVTGGAIYEMDGVALPMPLYRSARWGLMLFSPPDVGRATLPESYVLGHPNRPLLDATLRDMQALAARHGFRVTVILAPTAARLYGATFEGFPALSAEPWFTDYVARQADSLGFGVVDLVRLMRPAAEREMLYYRDDHHWNERGNAVAAELIGQHAPFSSPPSAATDGSSARSTRGTLPRPVIAIPR